jgi:TetR/AcrR family transcriptional repressor of nem operon
MPRGKTFDPDSKLDIAVELFWRRGVDATGMHDIVEALGVNRGSLYATYGDKEQLWRATLSRYCDLLYGQLLAVLAEEGPLLPRLRGLLESLADPDSGRPRGCLIVNAITERLPHDAGTREIVDHQVARVEGALIEAFRAADAAGEISSRWSTRQLARFVVATIQGLYVLDRAGASREAMADVIDVAMSALG